MKEIVYSETSAGLFEPAPTRAQKRKAKQAAETRSERMQGILLMVLIVSSYAAVIGLNLAAPFIWPVK